MSGMTEVYPTLPYPKQSSECHALGQDLYYTPVGARSGLGSFVSRIQPAAARARTLPANGGCWWDFLEDRKARDFRRRTK